MKNVIFITASVIFIGDAAPVSACVVPTYIFSMKNNKLIERIVFFSFVIKGHCYCITLKSVTRWCEGNALSGPGGGFAAPATP